MISAEVEAFSISTRPNFLSRTRSWRALILFEEARALPFEGGFEGAAFVLPGLQGGGGGDDLRLRGRRRAPRARGSPGSGRSCRRPSLRA